MEAQTEDRQEAYQAGRGLAQAAGAERGKYTRGPFTPEHRFKLSKAARLRWNESERTKFSITLPLDEIASLYKSGKSGDEIAEIFKVSRDVIYRRLKKIGISIRVPGARTGNQLGSENHNWKGDKATYAGCHLRVTRRRGQPKFCEDCKTKDPDKRYEWANLTGRYEDPNDYVRLCHKCHMIRDARKGKVHGGIENQWNRKVNAV